MSWYGSAAFSSGTERVRKKRVVFLSLPTAFSGVAPGWNVLSRPLMPSPASIQDAFSGPKTGEGPENIFFKKEGLWIVGYACIV